MKDNEIKYQASLRVFDQHVCSGTLISSRHILTAAHCIAGLGFTPPFEELTVVTGTKRLSDIKNSRSIFNISWNEKFVNGLGDTGYNKNDVAVITVCHVYFFFLFAEIVIIQTFYPFKFFIHFPMQIFIIILFLFSAC